MAVPYPGFGKPWGVIAAVAIIVFAGVGLFALFRRNDWL